MSKAILEEITVRKRFARGDVIFRERDQASEAFVIESGRVEISTDVDFEPRVLAVLGPGEMFGEMAALDGTLLEDVHHLALADHVEELHRRTIAMEA